MAQPRIALVYTDNLSNTHLHSFGCKQYNWNQIYTQNSAADQAFFDAWCNAVKPLLGTSYNIQSMRLINADGSVAKEYIPAAAVAGTHTNVVFSASATIGFTYSAFAQGLSGKGHHGTAHLKLQHGDFMSPGLKSRPCTDVAAVNTYRTWLVGNMPVAVGADVSANFRTYFTLQYNTYYQRRYGS